MRHNWTSLQFAYTILKIKNWSMTNSTSVQIFVCVYIVGREYDAYTRFAQYILASIQIMKYTFTKKYRKIPIFISFIKNKTRLHLKKYQARLKKTLYNFELFYNFKWKIFIWCNFCIILQSFSFLIPFSFNMKKC